MRFRRYVPQGKLSEFVGCFWYCEGYNLPLARERLLPTGTVELVVDLGSGRAADSVVAGVRSRPCVIQRSAQDRLLGIHFKPGGAYPFLPFPFEDLHNLDITLDDLWGAGQTDRLLCQVQEAPSVVAKFQVVERWLLESATRPLQHHPAVVFALTEFQRVPARLTTAGVVNAVNCSHRRFVEMFRGQIGLTPKLFARIQRFQRALSLAQQRTVIDWLDIALTCGYADQAHFIHDFREFSGFTPTEYRALRTEHLNHVRLRD